MSERRDTLTMVPVDYDPFGDAAVPAQSYAPPSPQWVPRVDYDPGLRADPLKLPARNVYDDPLFRAMEYTPALDVAGAASSGVNALAALGRGEVPEAMAHGYYALQSARDVAADFMPVPGFGAIGRGARAVAPYVLPAAAGAAALYPGQAEGGVPVKNALKAYHGSPHDFDAFDLSRIGSGEGHQAYGRGLYFAEAEPVAELYRPGHITHEMVGPEGTVLESGSRNRIGLTMGEQLRDVVQPEMKYLGNSIGALWAAGTPLTPENVARQAWGLDRKAAVPEVMRQVPDWRQHVQEAIDRTKPVLDQHRIEEKKMGRMYEVDLKVNPEHLIDWDRPVAGHSEHVRKALDALGVPERERVLNTTEDLTGRDVIMKLEQEGDPAAAMERLRDAGVKGVRFLDQNSRPRVDLERQLEEAKSALEDAKIPVADTAGARGVQSLWQDKIDRIEDQLKRMPPATRNYVMFDDKAIDIVRKYGLAALIGGGAAAAGAGEAEAAPRPKASALAAPAVHGEQPLFPPIDYGMQTPPGVVERDLPRKQPQKRLPEQILRLDTPEKIAQMNALVDRGRAAGSDQWYNFQPLRAKFHDYLGPAEGEKEFRNYLDMVGSSTALSSPKTNYRDASYYYGLMRRGEQLPEAQYVQPGEKPPKGWVADPETGQLFSEDYGKPMLNPQPYGHKGQREHRKNALLRMEGKPWDTGQNPKPPSFVENQMGNLKPYTLDTVGSGPLQWDLRSGTNVSLGSPEPTWYPFIEGLAQREASKMGIPTAWWQAGHWVGSMTDKELAKVGGKAPTGMDFLEQRIRHTARVRGERPEETLRKFIVEGIPILSVGGAGVVLLPVDHDPFAEQ